MKLFNDIFEELEIDINPYTILKIDPNSNDETIKNAYHILKKSKSNKEFKDLVEIAYRLIRNKELRTRFNLLRNKPYDSLDSIKELGLKPIKLTTTQWLNYIK